MRNPEGGDARNWLYSSCVACSNEGSLVRRDTSSATVTAATGSLVVEDVVIGEGDCVRMGVGGVSNEWGCCCCCGVEAPLARCLSSRASVALTLMFAAAV